MAVRCSDAWDLLPPRSGALRTATPYLGTPAGYRAMQFNSVVTANKAAVNLWLSLGFEIIGTLPGVFHHATLGYVDAHVMFLALEGNS